MAYTTLEIVQTALVILQVIACPILIILILLQSGKADDLGSALGGGGSGSSTVLGTGGASKFLVRATVVVSVFFMTNSVALAYIYKESLTSSAVKGMEEPLAPAPEALPEEGMGTPTTGFGSEDEAMPETGEEPATP